MTRGVGFGPALDEFDKGLLVGIALRWASKGISNSKACATPLSCEMAATRTPLINPIATATTPVSRLRTKLRRPMGSR